MTLLLSLLNYLIVLDDWSEHGAAYTLSWRGKVPILETSAQALRYLAVRSVTVCSSLSSQSSWISAHMVEPQSLNTGERLSSRSEMVSLWFLGM